MVSNGACELVMQRTVNRKLRVRVVVNVVSVNYIAREVQPSMYNGWYNNIGSDTV